MFEDQRSFSRRENLVAATGTKHGHIDAAVASRADHRRSRVDAERLLDLSGALLGLFLLAPLFLAIALAIKLTSRGPVFFRQDRYGLGNSTFRIYKFRTMYLDQQDDSGVTQTVSGDSRVTVVGRFLRASSFDELPQLINVLPTFPKCRS